MNKLILAVLMILLLQGCNDEKLESPDAVMEHVIEKALDIPFRNYMNLTATSGDYTRRMKNRYKLFKPYIAKERREQFVDDEIYWRYINEVSNNQCSLILQSLTFDASQTDNENEKTYTFTAVIEIIYENDNAPVDTLQYGKVKLVKSGGNWRIDSLEYDNHIFDN